MILTFAPYAVAGRGPKPKVCVTGITEPGHRRKQCPKCCTATYQRWRDKLSGERLARFRARDAARKRA